MKTKQLMAHIKVDMKHSNDESEIQQMKGYAWALEDMPKDGEAYEKFVNRFTNKPGVLSNDDSDDDDDFEFEDDEDNDDY